MFDPSMIYTCTHVSDESPYTHTYTLHTYTQTARVRTYQIICTLDAPRYMNSSDNTFQMIILHKLPGKTCFILE